jgi:valyl-tRNA synthetase
LSPKQQLTSISIVIPAPNPTGSLHLGHALNLAIQDVLARWYRSRGTRVYWQGATDHGGSSTEIVMHRQLQARSETPRDLSDTDKRALLVSLTHESVTKIQQQFRDLRLSVDTDSYRSMADADVQSEFDRHIETLFRLGHLYWAEKIDDWCYERSQSVPTYDCVPDTALESTHTLRYSIGAATLAIDHTELAFLLDEVGVAVPSGSDLATLEGQVAINPLGKPVFIYTAQNISRPVSLMPAHDDWSLRFCQSRNIEAPCSIDESGYIRGGSYTGQEFRTAARAMLALIREQGALILTREQRTDIQVCRGTGYRIYKRLVPGLFLRTSQFLQRAIDVVGADRISIYPTRYKKWLLNWFRGLLTLGEDADWRITREHLCGNPLPRSVVAHPAANAGYRLDMTISCALWPFIANSNSRRPPAGTLCATGVDLLFFWIGRVIVISIALERDLPLTEVIVHPLIADKRGNKMSKSAGNAVDLDEVIRQCGAPALRLYLLSRVDKTQEFIRVDCEEIRRLADELATRRAQPSSPDETEPAIPVEAVTRDLATIDEALAARDVGQAARIVLSWLSSCHKWMPLPKDVSDRVREISEVFMAEPLPQPRPRATSPFRQPQSAETLGMPGS